MKSVRLDRELAGYFFALDPFNCLNKLELPGCFAIGGFLETEDGDNPVSIVVFEVADDRLLIHWMYTLPEYRGEGLGSELLILVFEEAKSRGLTDVAARISDEYDVRAFNWHSWDFFVNDVFSVVEEGESEFTFTMSDIVGTLERDEKMNESAALNEGVIPLKELSREQLFTIERELGRSYSDTQEGTIEAAISAADPDVSLFRIVKGRCTGMLLIRRFGGTWYPYCLVAYDEEDEEILARAALYHSEDYAQMDDRIVIEVKRPVVKSLLNDIRLPGRTFDVEYLVASVKEFEKQKKLPEVTEEGGK